MPPASKSLERVVAISNKRPRKPLAGLATQVMNNKGRRYSVIAVVLQGAKMNNPNAPDSGGARAGLGA